MLFLISPALLHQLPLSSLFKYWFSFFLEKHLEHIRTTSDHLAVGLVFWFFASTLLILLVKGVASQAVIKSNAACKRQYLERAYKDFHVEML